MTELPKIGAPAQRSLQNAGISQLEQLTKVTKLELGQLHGMGPNALEKLDTALSKHGHSFNAPKKQSGIAENIRSQLDNIRSSDGQLQNEAYYFLMKETKKPVDWAYEAWDDLVAGLTHKDNHVRAISAQLLSNLAKSDPKSRMLKDFDKLLAVTKDEKFVTARHCLQSLWKVGAAGKKQQKNASRWIVHALCRVRHRKELRLDSL
jgi:hypothetical protein